MSSCIARHEDYLALKLGLQSGQTCLDVGCGVGGPLREMARFTGANIVGINNNDYQSFIIDKGLSGAIFCVVVLIWTVLALLSRATSKTCLSRKRLLTLRMQLRVHYLMQRPAMPVICLCRTLKSFAASSQAATLPPTNGSLPPATTPPTSSTKRLSLDSRYALFTKEGNSIPKLFSYQECLDALRKAGFEIIEWDDLADPTRATAKAQEPWYTPLVGSYALDMDQLYRWRMNPLGSLYLKLM